MPPNTKCFDNEQGNGLWNRLENWNPDGVPVSSDHVYHLIGGTITYNATQPENQAIASFTSGGDAVGLTISDGLPLNVLGTMQSNGAADYALTVKSRADLAIGADIRDVKVTLESGTSDEVATDVEVTGNVTGGDWHVPQYSLIGFTSSNQVP